jgi:demethylspheroidene O-methyltransferase
MGQTLAIPNQAKARPAGGRWFALRNRLLASPRFQRWAAAFPLTRPIAQRRAKAVFDLCAGFVYSQVLQACVQLRLFELLRDGPRPRDELAGLLGLSGADAARLLGSAAALQLLERRGPDCFGLGVLGAALLGNPGATAMIEHHTLFYADLRDPVALLRHEQRDTGLSRLWPYAEGQRPADLPAEDVAAYSTLMAASQPLVAADVLAAYRLDQHRCLLDLGGGDGTFLLHAAAAAPDVKLMLFDLPAVADRARARFAVSGLDGRATAFGGDFRSDPLPAGADIVSLVRVIHDHDDADVMTLLREVRRALPDNGTLLIAEPISGVRGTEPIGDAYFAFYLLAMGSGRPRTFARLREMLDEAGFADVALRPAGMPLLTSVITARAG